MNRIKYRPSGRPNEIKSTKNFPGQRGAFYVAKIDTENLTYRIVNVNTQKVIRSTEKDKVRKASQLRYVKEQVKRAMKKVGVEFDHEFRTLEEK